MAITRLLLVDSGFKVNKRRISGFLFLQALKCTLLPLAGVLSFGLRKTIIGRSWLIRALSYDVPRNWRYHFVELPPVDGRSLILGS
jgi:hypothetical protein